ncbi:MAG: dipeptide ABC transporter ATP-binding protein [Planctomycetota bacterium]
MTTTKTATETPILETQDLKVWFPVYRGVIPRHVADVKAVDGVSFSVRPGETIGVVGESGCGKSTLGKAIMGLVDSTDGKILFTTDEHPTVDLAQLGRRRMRPYRREIQMVYQDPYSSLNPRLSVEEIVSEPLSIHMKSMKPKERRDKVAWLLNKVGLNEDQMNRYPHEFSGGQRQRIGIARALATNPKLIIADEPVSALDVSIQAQVINLLMDLQEEFGLTFVFIAHDLSVVEHISKRVAVMYLGNIVEIGTTEQIMNQPKHPYTQALLSAVPRPDPELERPDRVALRGDVPSPMAKPSGCGFRTRCPIAQDRCAGDRPEFVDFQGGHQAACYYAE